MRNPKAVLITTITLAVTAGASLYFPTVYPPNGVPLLPPPTAPFFIVLLALAVWAAQFWRVAVRGTRGDVSISMAIDTAMMLLAHPWIAAAGSALGTGLYHLFGGRTTHEHPVIRALVRAVIVFSAVGLGGWLFHFLRPEPGPLVFAQDWPAITAGILLRLVIRMALYPLAMAAVRPDPLLPKLMSEWNRLPMVPFLLTTTLGGIAALIWQTQPAATVLLAGPLASTWAATREFGRLNELLATMDHKVTERTTQLAETVTALERRLDELRALNAVVSTMVEAIHPDEVLELIVKESARVTGATSSLVTLLSEDKRRQFVRAAYGGKLAAYAGTELPIEGSLSGTVVKTGEVLVSFDPPNDPRLNQALVKAGEWRHVIEAPLRYKDRVLGVLVVASSEPKGFDDQHLRLLATFGNQAGLFLEAARVHEKEREVAVFEERNRLARELHDSVTQVLFSLNLNLEAASGLVLKKPDRAAELVTRAQEMASEALAEMRSLIFELRPAALQEKGLANALANHTNLFRRRHGVAVTLNLEDDDRLAPEIEFCLYRVAQEALNNAAKHARASHITVSYTVGPEYASLLVQDDGVGFDASQPPGPQSFGMIGMQERLAELGGILLVESAPGQGTKIEARIPLTCPDWGKAP